MPSEPCRLSSCGMHVGAGEAAQGGEMFKAEGRERRLLSVCVGRAPGKINRWTSLDRLRADLGEA
jgi:hypothetical protein